MSGPVGSAYPGNVVSSVAACFFAVVAIRSAMSAYRRRQKESQEKDSSLQSWEADMGFSVVSLVAVAFFVYAIWVHQ